VARSIFKGWKLPYVEGSNKMNFEYMPSIASTQFVLGLPDEPRVSSTPNGYFHAFKDVSSPPAFDGVVPSKASVFRSVLKMDVKRSPERSEHMQKCIDSVNDRLLAYFNVDFCLSPSLVVGTSATFPFSKLGFSDKNEVLQHHDFQILLSNPLDFYCIWRISPKREFLEVHEIFDEKVRTFVIPPLHLLWWQKFFYEGQDSVLKKERPIGIQWGINFSNRGFHNLILDLCEDDPDSYWFVVLDVRGYDRAMCLMHDVHSFRYNALKERIRAAKLDYIYDWVYSNTVNSKVLLPDGQIVTVCEMNKSGSGTTTADNCISHRYVAEDVISHFDVGRSGHCKVAIYSDDIVYAIHKNLEEPTEDVFIKTYKSWGLEIKPGSFQILDGPVGATFLGGTCRLHKMGHFDAYIPSYSSERLRSVLEVDIVSKIMMRLLVLRCPYFS